LLAVGAPPNALTITEKKALLLGGFTNTNLQFICVTYVKSVMMILVTTPACAKLPLRM